MPSSRTKILSVGVTALLLVSTGAIVRAQDDTPPARPARDGTIPPGLLTLPTQSATAELAASMPQLEGTASLYGRIVYQGINGPDWDVFSGNDTEQHGAQFHFAGADDLEPRLSFDTTRIVFTSNRAGNFDLYSVDANGSGLRRLTDDGATDSAATWSPDGGRIAFQSNRTGNSDIYVMNADGSGVTRLTTNGDYDGEPAWSPDGTQIAFISKRTAGAGEYYLYVMNTSGGNQHLLAALPESGKPAWSLDGQALLIHAANSGGWLRLYRVAASTGAVQAIPATDSWANYDLEAASWGVGSRVYVTTVRYNISNGAWVVVNMLRGTVDTQIGGPVTNMGGSWAAAPDWGAIDRTPPVSFAIAPAAHVAADGVSVYSGGLDQGPAGILSYSFQARVGAGAWTDLGPETCGLGVGFGFCLQPPLPLGPVTFRVRAADYMGHQELWPEDPARWVQTIIYAEHVAGTATDIRGTPLAGVGVQGPPALNPGQPTASDGGFDLYLTESGSLGPITGTVNSGSAVLLPGGLQSLGNHNWRGPLWVLPSTNALTNGDFENALVGWTNSGNLPVTATTTASAFSGNRLVELGGDTHLRVLAPDIIMGRSARSETGTATVYTDRNYLSYLVQCPYASPCSTPELLGAPFAYDIFVEADGTIDVVLVDIDTGQTEVRRRAPNGAWAAPEPVAIDVGSGDHRLLQSPSGRLYLVSNFGDGATSVAHRNDNGSWVAETNLGDWPMGLDAAFDIDGGLHLIGCASSGAFARSWTSVGGWGAIQTIDTSAPCATYGHVAATVDSAGRLNAVWPRGDRLVTARRSLSGTWSAVVESPVTLSQMNVAASGPGGRPVALNVIQDMSGGHAWIATVGEEGLWTPLTQLPEVVWPIPLSVWAAFDWSTQRLFAWTGDPVNPTFQVMVDQALAPQEQASSVSQVLTLPANLSLPTFALAYAYGSTTPNDPLRLSVADASGQLPTQSVDLPFASGWLTGHIDLSAFAGHTITMTIGLVDKVNEAHGNAWIDRAIVSDWTTPVVVAQSTTRLPDSGGTIGLDLQTLPGVPVVTIGGQVMAFERPSELHLNVAVPSGALPPGRYAIVVASSNGFATAAPQPLVIGHVLNLPTLLRFIPGTIPAYQSP